MGKSMMARPQEQRLRWTREEDQKLRKYIENINDDRISWKGIAALARLENKADKSCWERWHNHLKPSVNKANFSQEEDHDILFFHGFYGNKWASIRDNHLPRRSANDIKNRYNNHLKKKKQLATSTHQNIPDPQLFHLNQNLPNASSIPTPISASQEIVNPFFTAEAYPEFRWDDELHSLIAGFWSNVNPNETNFEGDYFEPGISGPVSASVENAFMPTEQVIRNWSP